MLQLYLLGFIFFHKLSFLVVILLVALGFELANPQLVGAPLLDSFTEAVVHLEYLVSHVA